MTQSQPQTYNRSAEDVGNIVELGHINVEVPDQLLATNFYVTGLGLTRDPYLVTGTNNMWVNVGKSQFHLPTRPAQILRGVAGLVVPDLSVARTRLDDVRPQLAGTQFAVNDLGDAVEVTSPWGNRLRLHGPDPDRFGPIVLGMAYIAFEVNPGTADGIARFYREILDAPAEVIEVGGSRTARVRVGYSQWFDFREVPAGEAPYDGHHVQVYLANFSGPYRKLVERGLITQESNQHQYRFVDLVDLDSGQVLFKIDHEVRSMSHPMYARPLVNRDPSMNNVRFHPGQEHVAWAMAT
jgi:hypothetical protein